MSRSSSSSDHIVTRKLRKVFGQQAALESVDLTIQRSQIAVIIGGSGAGKTTLLRLLIGLDKPTSGQILIDGMDIVPLGERKMNDVRRRFGMVFQYAALLDSLNVLENLAFPLREHTRMKEKEIRAKVAEKLEILGLAGTERKFPSELSGGMRKRVGLARALMLEPEIVVYDEPTSGLDPLTSRLVDDLILETRDRYGVTSVVISHDMMSAMTTADRIYLLSAGRIVYDAPAREFRSSDHPLVVDFMQSSGIVGDGARTEPPAIDYRPR